MQQFRPFAYFASVAFLGGTHLDMVHRIRAVNGTDSGTGPEIFTPTLIKGSGSALAAPDVEAFIDFFLNSSLATVKSAENIRSRLKDLGHYRAARLHVYCRDGRVPQEKSMPFLKCDADPASSSLSLPQGTRRPSVG